MAETVTPHFGWTKPDIGGDASNWGNVLNATTDAIDSVVYANQQAGVPIGSGALWFTATVPTNWLLCQGQSLDTTVYAALFAILGYAFGGSGANFNLPNFTDIFPIGASATRALAAKGGLATVTLDATMIPAHTHTATQGTHTHTATQPAHNHGDQGHGHGVSESPHVHGSNLLRTGAGSATAYAGGAPQISGSGNTDGAVTGISIATGFANLAAAQPAITVAAQSAGAITVNPTTGGGQPHNNMPPWLGINFIIRFQ